MVNCKSKIENCAGLRLCDDNIGLNNWKIDPEIRYNTCVSNTRLDMNEKGITTIPAKYFHDHSRLEYLNLHNNNISELKPNVFKNLISLIKLNLGSNSMTQLPTELFKFTCNTKFRHLDINNKLVTLDEDQFSSLAQLRKLILSSNQIQFLPEKLFRNNTELIELWLDNNQLTGLPAKLFRYNYYRSVPEKRGVKNGLRYVRTFWHQSTQIRCHQHDKRSERLSV